MDEHAAQQDLIARTRALLGSLQPTALSAVLAAWPQAVDASAWRALPSNRLPALRWLPAAFAAAPEFSAPLVGALAAAAPLLAWRQTYAAGQLGAAFCDNYAWTELFGAHGPLASERIACGFLLLGPSTQYPRHRHEATEWYIPLSGTAAWQQSDGPWHEWCPGTLIVHGSEEAHAMRAGASPLLALYCWRSEDLAQQARLDPCAPAA